MNIQLSEHFTYSKLLRFTLPSIAMMIFTSVYGVVDGIFVSNFAGKTAFAAINLIMPYLMVFGTLGFMVGTGGTALISMTLRAFRIYCLSFLRTLVLQISAVMLPLVWELDGIWCSVVVAERGGSDPQRFLPGEIPQPLPLLLISKSDKKGTVSGSLYFCSV